MRAPALAKPAQPTTHHGVEPTIVRTARFCPQRDCIQYHTALDPWDSTFCSACHRIITADAWNEASRHWPPLTGGRRAA